MLQVPEEFLIEFRIRLDTIAVYNVRLTIEFRDWLDGLADKRAEVRITARLRLAEAGSLGDRRSVGSEVSGMRIDHGPGYRLYFTRRENMLIIMFAGGDKSSQRRDMVRAQRIASEMELES